MSATNRGGLERAPGDFYQTPTWCVDALIPELGLPKEWEGYAVDPGSGTGAIAERVAWHFPRAEVRGVEANPRLVEVARGLRNDRIVFEEADFLTWKAEAAVDLIIGNPPYGKRLTIEGERTDDKAAEKFIIRALELASKKAHVAMLLRASYLVAKVRRELRAHHHPCDILFLETRPSFNGSGCDSTDYAWFVWGPKRGGKWKVLPRPAPPVLEATATPIPGLDPAPPPTL